MSHLRLSDQVVFVVGAGASAPYEIPVASRLRERLLERNHPSVPGELEHRREILNLRWSSFQAAFRRSGLISVDRFLQRRPEFSEIGQWGISSVIGLAEADAMSKGSRFDDWHGWLVNTVFANDEFGSPRSRFVTFNYDRLLELVLAECAAARTNGDALACYLEAVAPTVRHVYGKLSSQLREDAERGYVVPDTSPKGILQSGRGIRIAGQQPDDSDEGLEDLREWISDAKQVVFLGFSFDHENLKQLGLSPTQDTRDIKIGKFFACCYGMSAGERRRVNEHFHGRITLGDASLTAHEFLRHVT